MTRYLSVCSGIESASVAWEDLGWTPEAFAEIDPFPSAVLANRWPHVPNLGDFTKISPEPGHRINVLVGGTPCQGFSVAGLRSSLSDDRSNLCLAFVELAHALYATGPLQCVVWENVPGVLNTKDNAFGCFVGGLIGADDAVIPCARPPQGRSGPCWRWDAREGAHVACWPGAGMASGPLSRVAWRVLDAQHFGVPQRRRRVFLVASFGDVDPAAVLFEPRGVPGDFAAREEAGQDIAGTLSARSSAGGGLGTDFELGGGLVPAASLGGNGSGAIDVAAALTAKGGSGRMDFESETLIAFDETQITSAANRSQPRPGDPCCPLAAGARPPTISFNCREDPVATGDVAGALGASSPQAQAVAFPCMDEVSAAARRSGVRRLTPAECEILQGFPVGHTLIPMPRVVRRRVEDDFAAYMRRHLPGVSVEEIQRLAADGPRYRALGNSKAVPCVRWIGQRIQSQIAEKP